jgi:hypothetical protein
VTPSQSQAPYAAVLGMSANATINLILLLCVLACFGYVVMLMATTKEMRRLSDWLNAKADARDYFDRRYRWYRTNRAAAERNQARAEEITEEMAR